MVIFTEFLLYPDIIAAVSLIFIFNKSAAVRTLIILSLTLFKLPPVTIADTVLLVSTLIVILGLVVAFATDDIIPAPFVVATLNTVPKPPAEISATRLSLTLFKDPPVTNIPVTLPVSLLKANNPAVDGTVIVLPLFIIAPIVGVVIVGEPLNTIVDPVPVVVLPSKVVFIL